MTKMYIESALSTRKHCALSELSEDEIFDLLDEYYEDKNVSLTPFEDEQFSFHEDITEDESELFFNILNKFTEGSLSFGEAMILLASFACTVEERVLMRS